MLLQPKSIEINGKTFILSKFTATAGREIVSKYPLSMVPKLGDYAVNEATMLKLMSFVGVDLDGRTQPLSNRALVDNHCVDWETLALIEKEMLEYNCSFLTSGLVSTFLQDLAQNIPQWISQMLTGLLAELSEQEKQRSTS